MGTVRLPCRGAPDGAGLTLDSMWGLLFEPAPLSSPVLEPGFHLSLCELQTLCQSLPFWRGQVFLRVKLLLQFQRLLIGETNLTPFSLVQGPREEGAPEQRFAQRLVSKQCVRVIAQGARLRLERVQGPGVRPRRVVRREEWVQRCGLVDGGAVRRHQTREG